MYRPGDIISGGKAWVSRSMSAPVYTAVTPGRPPRRRHVDRHDPGVGERAAQERRVQDAVGLEVGDVAAVADQQPVVLDAGDALPDEATHVRPGTHRPLAFMTSTARSTPATIDW